MLKAISFISALFRTSFHFAYMLATILTTVNRLIRTCGFLAVIIHMRCPKYSTGKRQADYNRHISMPVISA